jgi:hypothetical protein
MAERDGIPAGCGGRRHGLPLRPYRTFWHSSAMRQLGRTVGTVRYNLPADEQEVPDSLRVNR